MSMRGRKAARLFCVARQGTQCPHRTSLPRPPFVAQGSEADLNCPALTTALAQHVPHLSKTGNGNITGFSKMRGCQTP